MIKETNKILHQANESLVANVYDRKLILQATIKHDNVMHSYMQWCN